MTTAIHMDQQGPQETQPVENQQPINPPAEPAPVAPAEQESAPVASENKPEAGIGKIDLSALASFSFGTQWTSANAGGGERREGRGDRGARPDRRNFAGGGERGDRGDMRRDRRPSVRPVRTAEGNSDAAAAASAGEGRPDRQFRGDRGPAGQQGGGNFRRERQGGAERGGERRFARGPRFDRPAPQDNRPYVSPFFEVAFYAEDTAFSALVKAIRASCHTYELFEIARVVLGKNDRFVVVVQRKPDAANKRAPIFVTPVDGLPFDNEDEAVQHVLRNHLGDFFTMSEVEVEAPKGNFQFVMRCGITGELLAPPNYHRYQNILQQHHAAKLGNMPFERFRERLETVKEPEAIAQWTEKMKKVTRYVWKEALMRPLRRPSTRSRRRARICSPMPATRSCAASRAPVSTARSPTSSPRARSCRRRGTPRTTAPLPARHRQRPARAPAPRRLHDLQARLEGRVLRLLGETQVPLPGQVFSESITVLIDFIEKNPVVSVKELPAKHLGINQPEAAAVADSSAAPVEAAPNAALSPEDDAKLKRLWMDLRWLVTEGYVTEYSDGKLFAPPPMTAQQQKSEDAANAAADAVEEAARAAAEAATPAVEPAPAPEASAPSAESAAPAEIPSEPTSTEEAPKPAAE
jgi:hypothetical protein